MIEIRKGLTSHTGEHDPDCWSLWINGRLRTTEQRFRDLKNYAKKWLGLYDDWRREMRPIGPSGKEIPVYVYQGKLA